MLKPLRIPTAMSASPIPGSAVPEPQRLYQPFRVLCQMPLRQPLGAHECGDSHTIRQVQLSDWHSMDPILQGDNSSHMSQ